MFYRKKKYEMDMNTANTALQNILSACDQAPNTIPFDKILLRQKVNLRVYNRLLILTAFVFLLTFLSPLSIVPAARYVEQLIAPTPAELVMDYMENDILYLQFTGDNILYQEAYLQLPDGEIQSALSFDSKEQIISFPYFADTEVNIYIPVKDSEPMHFLITPHKE